MLCKHLAATLPFNVEKVHSTLKKVERFGGEELAVEACLIAATFETVTKIVDSTIRYEESSSTIMINTVVRFINNAAFGISRLWKSGYFHFFLPVALLMIFCNKQFGLVEKFIF